MHRVVEAYLSKHGSLVHVPLQALQEPSIVLEESAVLATAATRRRLWNVGVHVRQAMVRRRALERRAAQRKAGSGRRTEGRGGFGG